MTQLVADRQRPTKEKFHWTKRNKLGCLAWVIAIPLVFAACTLGGGEDTTTTKGKTFSIEYATEASGKEYKVIVHQAKPKEMTIVDVNLMKGKHQIAYKLSTNGGGITKENEWFENVPKGQYKIEARNTQTDETLTSQTITIK